MPEFSRDEIESALRRTLELGDHGDWSGFADTFTEDAVYVEHHLGVFEGREKIRGWLVPVMEPCKDWTFPTEWIAIDGKRAIYKWQNQLPGRRADGTPYEFAGITIKEYAGDGRFSFQEDVYNWEEAARILKEWSADRSRTG